MWAPECSVKTAQQIGNPLQGDLEGRHGCGDEESPMFRISSCICKSATCGRCQLH
jgi:hypothetical protein